MRFGSSNPQQEHPMDSSQRSLLFADIIKNSIRDQSDPGKKDYECLRAQIKAELKIQDAGIDKDKAADFLTVLEIFSQKNTDLVSFLPVNGAGGAYIPPELLSSLTNYSIEEVEKYLSYFFGVRSLDFNIVPPTMMEIN